MKSTSQHALHLTSPAAKPASRARKQFNTLINKLEAARSLLAAWKETLPAVMRKVDAQYQPLMDTCSERMKQLMLLLDEMHGHKLLGKRERDKLSKFIAHMTLDLVSEADDEVLKQIYNRHSGDDYDAYEEERNEDLKQLMESLLGAEFKGEIDTRAPEAMFAAFQAQLDEQFGAAPEPAQRDEPARPKRATELARERRQEAEAQRLQQSMREIFRKLASQLHPDREPDHDERQRKTALMQRVNVAYAANDMLGLLELQLEVEQIDQASLASLSDERIKQYNKVLSGQLGELESEIAGFVEMAAIEMDAETYYEVTPAAMMRAIDNDIAHQQLKLMVIEEDLRALGDVKLLKAWLKDLAVR